jgi:hypothetical protein
VGDGSGALADAEARSKSTPFRRFVPPNRLEHMHSLKAQGAARLGNIFLVA